MVLVTVYLSLWKIQQRWAVRAFEEVSTAAEAQEDPRQTIAVYEEYIRTHPDNAITREARRRCDAARERVAGYEYQQAERLADERGENFEAAEEVLRRYLAAGLPSPYREKAEGRLRRLPAMIEDRDYRKVNEQFPPPRGIMKAGARPSKLSWPDILAGAMPARPGQLSPSRRMLRKSGRSQN